MARNASRLVLLCAGLLALTLTARPSRGGDDADDRLRNQLAMQAALEQGLDQLQRGNFERAVVILEKQIPHIDGNRRYLIALRDAYRGYIKQLEQSGQRKDIGQYRDRLAILEPGSRFTETTDLAPRAPAPAVRADAVAPKPRPASPPGIVSRGKMEQDDPFSESNSAGEARAREVLLRADSAFASRRYAEAGQLYTQSDRLHPGIVASSQEKWAYCRLFGIAQALNRTADAPSADLEQEVQRAVRMAPKLDGFGRKLLERIRDAGAASSVAIKHLPREGNGWAVAETTSIRVFHTLDREQAEKVMRIAESTRVSMARKWFGEEPAAWTPRCDIYIHPTGQGYAKTTGAPATAPGHSTLSLDAGRVITRRIDIRGDDPNFMIGVLPHETTHVVLAGRFGRHHVPRWADEGIAVLSEPRNRIDMHLRNLNKHRGEATLFRTGELIRMADYPEPRRVGPFYAQSVSLVEFLALKKGPTTFIRFLREGLDGNYEAALQRYYGYRSFEEVDREWTNHAFAGGAVATVGER